MLNIESFKSNIQYSNGKAEFNHIKFLTNESKILGDIIVNIKNIDSDGLNGTTLGGHLNEIILSNNEMSKLFNIPLELDPLNGNIRFNGSLNNINISKFDLSNKDLLFSGSADLRNIFDKDFEISTEIKSLYFSSNGLIQSLKSLPRYNAPEKIKQIGSLNLIGSIKLNNNSLITDFICFLEKGNIIASIDAGIRSLKKDLFFEEIKSDIKFQNFGLGKFFDGFGELNGDLNLLANGPISNIKIINLESHFIDMNFFNKTFSNIKMNLRKTANGYDNKLTINDSGVKVDLSLLSEYRNNDLFHNGLIKISKIDLNKFYSSLNANQSDLSGNILIDYSGNDIDNLSGILNFQDFKFSGDYSDYKFSNFLVENFYDSSHRVLEIKNSNAFTGKIHGNFSLSNFNHLFKNFLNEIYQPLSKEKVINKQDLSFNFNVNNDFIKAFYPMAKSDESVTIEGNFSTKKNNSKLRLYIPFFIYKNINLYGVDINVDSKNINPKALISINEIKNNNYSFRDINGILNNSDDQLDLNLSFEEGDKFKNKFSINSKYSFNDGKSLLEIDKSEILFKNNLWIINGRKSGKLTYNNINQKFELDSFNAKINDEEISFSGSYLSTKDFELSLNIDDVSINKVSPNISNFEINGKLNSTIELKRSLTNNTLEIEIDADDFQINDQEIGDVSIISSGNTQINSYGIDILVEKNKLKILEGNGSLLGIDMNPRLDIDLTFNKFNLDFLSPIGKENIKNIRGEVSGNVNLWGPIESPYHTGKLKLNNSGLKINYINADYSFIDGTEVFLVNQGFNLKNTKFIDNKYQTHGFVSGGIDHVNFKDWNFDLKINSENIMMVDIPENEDAIFYGNGFFKGDVTLTGSSKNLIINVKGETQEGTIINIPWAEDYGIIDPSFIEFKDKSRLLTNLTSKNDFKNIQGLEMNFELAVDSDAEIAIVIDDESGSFLKGKGGGNILMEINTKGKFNIWGDYIVSEGIYNFKNLSLIDKKFILKPGGTIAWEGDPYSAIMDIEAMYKVPGGANPALLLDNPNFNKKIPTDVIIKLQGNLLKPDDPLFQINFPNASGVVKSEINYRLSDPQISQLQAISLLSQGIFISDVSVSIQGITNNLYEKASDIFSNLIGSDEGRLILGVNYLQGDKSEYLDLDSEDRLGLTLSTQITDKILINGEIGVPFGGVEETLIVGDVQIDFILNEDGSLKAKVFNKENEFRYIGDELGYTQGVGISYEVDFETFSELLSKILIRKND